MRIDRLRINICVSALCSVAVSNLKKHGSTNMFFYTWFGVWDSHRHLMIFLVDFNCDLRWSTSGFDPEIVLVCLVCAFF